MTDANDWGRPTRAAILVTAAVVGTAAVLLSLEALLALALRAEPGGPAFWRKARSEYYMRFERHIVQYLPECAQFDPRLAYRLKPGHCRFSNREYAHEIAVNSAGMRDREEALVRPRIVVTGDSFAMGWGVAQTETLSAVLAELTGEKTLNAAEPSYGTAREMLLLGEVDLSAAHTLVIQYCENDSIENRRFLEVGGTLPTMSFRVYKGLVDGHLAATRYHLGDHLRHLLVPLLRWAAQSAELPGDRPRDCPGEAREFLAVLARAGPSKVRMRLFVFEALYTADQRSCFSTELAKLVAQDAQLPAWISEVRVVDPTPLLVASDYYPLDEHLKASGYRKIAQAVAGAISERAH